MKRKISAAIVAALVGSMLVGSTVFAASPNTTNTSSTSIVASQEAREGRTIYAVPTAQNEGTATVEGTRITVNYSEVTVPGSIETAVAAPTAVAAVACRRG